MAKLALLVATFALAFFLVNASIYRTTITLDGKENRSGRDESSCQEQIRKQRNLHNCQRYMEEEIGGSSRYNTHLLNSCCDQLQNLEEDCRCPGLKQAVRQQLREGEWEREEAKEMCEVAEMALRKCDLEPRNSISKMVLDRKSETLRC